MSSTLRYLSFIIVPAITLFIALRMQESFGEYYFSHNSDPAYLYLINSLDVATFQPVRHVDNPGTTVQVLGGVVIRALAFRRDADDIERDVLQNPELYLSAINKVLLAVNILAIMVLGLVAFNLTGSMWQGILLQSGIFSSWLMVKAMVMVSPEPMSVLTGIFYIIMVAWAAEREIHLKKPGLFTVLISFITAFGIATKLTFIPFIIIPLFILRGFKWKAIYFLLTTVLFHTLLIPAYCHYDFFLHWVKLLLLNTQPYGQGAPSIIDIGDATLNLVKLIILEHTFFITLLFSIVLLVFIFANKKLKDSLKDNHVMQLLIGMTLVMVVHTLLVAKNYNPRYLMPSLLLSTTLLYLDIKVIKLANAIHPLKIRKPILFKTVFVVFVGCLLFIRHYAGFTPGDTAAEWMQSVSKYGSWGEWFNRSFVVHWHWLVSFLILFPASILILRHKMPLEKLNNALTGCVIIIISAHQLRHIDIAGQYRRLENSKQQALATIAFTHEYENYTKILGERSSSKYYALKYGTSTNFTQQSQLERMQELYPGMTYFWGLKMGSREFESWTSKISLADILKQNDRVILQGDINNLTTENISMIESSNSVILKPLYKGGLEVVYLVSRR